MFTPTLEHAIAKKYRTPVMFKSILPTIRSSQTCKSEYRYKSAHEIICFIQL